MYLDPNCEKLRPLNEYTKRIPSTRPGKKLSRSTLWRWVLHGRRGVKLQTFVLGSGRYTSDAEVMKFSYKLTLLTRSGSQKGPAVVKSGANKEQVMKRFKVKEADSSPGNRPSKPGENADSRS
jgi:hypothetical protein